MTDDLEERLKELEQKNLELELALRICSNQLVAISGMLKEKATIQAHMLEQIPVLTQTIDKIEQDLGGNSFLGYDMMNEPHN